MKKQLIYLLFALFWAGCAPDNSSSEIPEEKNAIQALTTDELKFLSMAGRENKFNQSEIARIIGDAIDVLDSNPSTRSESARTVAETYPLSMRFPSVSTRSGDDEYFYVVNFEEDNGYAIIAVDRRIDDEIAVFVGHGSLDENSDNPGLAAMLSRLDSYAARSIARHEAWCD